MGRHCSTTELRLKIWPRSSLRPDSRDLRSELMVRAFSKVDATIVDVDSDAVVRRESFST